MLERIQALPRYLLARLQEPGSMRSVIWGLLGTAGYQASGDLVTELTSIAMIALSVASFLMPEKK